MFSLSNKSISQKVSGLSSFLLIIIFSVVVFSVVKLNEIDKEMKEVSQIDLPLTSVMSRIEMLQLKQHLLFENIRFNNQLPDLDGNIFPSFSEEMASYNSSLEVELLHAKKIIEDALEYDELLIEMDDHRKILVSINDLIKTRKVYEADINNVMADVDGLAGIEWQTLETQNKVLDEQVIRLLIAVEQVTQEVVHYIEKHERDFVTVTTVLGLGAFLIGCYMSYRIIQVFRLRLKNINQEISAIESNISVTENANLSLAIASQNADELAHLEHTLKVLKERLEVEVATRQEVENELVYLANTDRLTGANNRHKWEEQLKTETLISARGPALSLIMFDVDHFKKINDTYGHDVGDKVLQALVNLVKERTRESECLYRIGGEEFTLLLRNCTLNAAQKVAETLRQKVEVFESDLPKITISLGVCEFLKDEDIESFLKRTDQALYKAKNYGRNRVEVG